MEPALPLITSHDDFGEKLIGRLASIHGGPVPAKLDVTQLDALFRWMAEHFPPSADPEMYGAVTPRMEISIWRGKLIEAIARQGTARR